MSNNLSTLETEFNFMKLKSNEYLNYLANISVNLQSIKNGFKLFADSLPNYSDNKINKIKKVNSNSQKIYNIEQINQILNNSLNEFNIKFTKTIKKLEDEVMYPLENLYSNTNIILNENLNEFKVINSKIKEHNLSLNKSMEKYKNSLELNKNIDKKSDEFVMNNLKIENCKQMYKYEINQINEIIDDCNVRYEIIMNRSSANKESCNNMCVEILRKFQNFMKNILLIFESFSNDILNKIINKFENVYINNEQKNRFKKVKFIEKFNNNNNNKNFDIFDEFEDLGNDLNINIIQKPISIINENNNNKENKIENYFNNLISEKEIKMDLIQEINFFNGNNNNFNYENSILFLNRFLKNNIKKHNNNFINNEIEFKNKENLIHFSNILNFISENSNNNKENFNNLSELIIKISEKVCFKNIYLYTKLSKVNKFYTTKNFWKSLIKNIFIKNLNSYVNNNLLNIQTENKKNSSTNRIFLLEFLDISPKIKNYIKLNSKNKLHLENYARNNIEELIKDFIIKMSNFKTPKKICEEILTEFKKEFSIDEEKLKYFLNLLHSNLSKNYLSNQRNFYDKNSNSGKEFIILNSASFLSNNDLMNLLLANKEITNSIKKKIVKKVILKDYDLTLNKRIKIWEYFLSINKIKLNFNYNEILLEMNKLNISDKNTEVIDLDVVRTFFISDLEKNQNKLRKILKCINFLFKNIGYCQGMNYIAAFLLQIFNYDEEKTFIFMVGILKNTEFGTLFENDLKLLKIYFFIVDKIIEIFLPKIHKIFMKDSILTNFFAPSWFLTIFTNISNQFEIENAPKVSILVVENFFVEGWISVIRTGFTLINYYQEEIVKLKRDEILNFMINNLIRLDLVKNENFNEFLKHYEISRKKIKKDLIQNLAEIYLYEEKNKIIDEN